jgi:hypothetical protein
MREMINNFHHDTPALELGPPLGEASKANDQWQTWLYEMQGKTEKQRLHSFCYRALLPLSSRDCVEPNAKLVVGMKTGDPETTVVQQRGHHLAHGALPFPCRSEI